MARVLVFSTLFPNAAQPNHGVFVKNRLRETLALGGLEATVLAPVPWFPSSHPRFGRYASFARAPLSELQDGVEVLHPRYLVVPRVGGRWTPGFLYRAALARVRGLMDRGAGFDVIDAHYFYPDGVAAARLGRALRLPVVITARGSDITLLAGAAGPRAQIQWAAQEASATVSVCDDLRRRLLALQAPAERALVLRNGVDLDLFRPLDRDRARRDLNVSGFTLLSVGALIPRKGHALIIEALTSAPDCTLLIAGTGPLRGELQDLAERLGVGARVRFLGEIPHRDLPRIYAAADIFVLTSAREGWANVLLEAMACGVPVLASNVNGAPEVVRSPAAGRLLVERTPACLSDALADLRRHMPHRGETRRYAEQFGWGPVACANKALLEAVARAGYERRYSAQPAIAARTAYAGSGGLPARSDTHWDPLVAIAR